MTVSTTERAGLTKQVAYAICMHGLLERGDRVLVAVSGGADSVSLLTVLLQLAASFDLTLQAVHLNHGLRGEESDADAAFVVDLCRGLGIGCRCESLPVAACRLPGQSRQAVARDLRYEALQRISASEGWTRVALGHTLDDQAETVLMWLVRGAAARGLAGIPWTRPPCFIRPLLGVSRTQILGYLEEQGLPHREDSSNATPTYLRNRVRHRLLPLLREFNPSIAHLLSRQAAVLSEEDRYLDECAAAELRRITQEEVPGRLSVNRDGLLRLPLAVRRRVIRQALQRVTGMPHPPSLTAVSDTLRCAEEFASGRRLAVPGASVRRDYELVRLERVQADLGVNRDLHPMEQGASIPLSVPSVISWHETQQQIRADLVHWDGNQDPGMLHGGPFRAMLDADRMTLDLHVRGWQRGDRVSPLGMGGKQKKLQDLFSDRHVPQDLRHRIPLVVAPEGILWVVGHQLDHRFRVTDRTTRILRLAVTDDGPRREKP